MTATTFASVWLSHGPAPVLLTLEEGPESFPRPDRELQGRTFPSPYALTGAKIWPSVSNPLWMGINKNGMFSPEVCNPWFYQDFPESQALLKDPGFIMHGSFPW